WQRIQDYYSGAGGNCKALYCEPRHADGTPVTWDDLLAQGNLIHGRSGSSRQVLDYDLPGHSPFLDLYGEPVKYRFFVPTARDLLLSEGLILCTGRSALSEQSARTAFAVSTFNTGKLTPAYELPAENPLFISQMLAERYNLSPGDRVWVTNRETRVAMVLSVMPTSRLKGEIVYLSIHKNRAELDQGRLPNLLTSHRLRCPYTGQTGHKLTRVELHKVE
ncbi:MAG: molybdopterin dinucleotide binding domain-containing protein, partial [Candidatus Sericytochromatia bacterium]